VTGSPFDHFASSRNLNVQVSPSSDTLCSIAIASEASPFSSRRYNPSIVAPKNSKPYWSVTTDESMDGIVSPFNRFNTCSVSFFASPDFSFSEEPELSLDPLPHAASTVLTRRSTARRSDHFLFFIL